MASGRGNPEGEKGKERQQEGEEGGERGVGLLKFLMKVMANRHEVRVTLSDGRVLTRRWHPSFANRPALVGRRVDFSESEA